MKQKFMSVFMIFILFCGVLFSSGAAAVTVTVKTEYGKVLKVFYSSKDISQALDSALDYAKRTATKQNLLTIELKKGTYNVTKTLHLTSYITIDLCSSKLNNAIKSRGNIFKSPEDKVYKGYSSLEQVTVKNGTLNDRFNHNKSCIMRLCHSKNIVLDNIEFLNNYYSHHLEIAASKDILIKNCLFKGQVSDLNINSSEAVQLDILDKVHFVGFTGYDNTMNDSITIEKCIFKNVYRGIGTHNYFRNLYQTNITISECSFENIADCAVSAVNFSNTVYKNNTYKNCRYAVFARDNGK